MAANKPPVSIDPIDPGTSKFSTVWARWFLDIYNQLGGVDSAGSVDSASFTSDGTMTRITDPDTGEVSFVSRLPTGTADQIVITNADGVDGDPVWSLSDSVVLVGSMTVGQDLILISNDGFSTTISASPDVGTNVDIIAPAVSGTLATTNDLNTAISNLGLTAKNYIPWGCFGRVSCFSKAVGTRTGSIAIGTGLYVADMWHAVESSGAVITAGISTSSLPTLSTYSPHVDVIGEAALVLNITTEDTSIAATERSYLRTFIPVSSSTYLCETGMTVSFWIKAPTPGTYCFNLYSQIYLAGSGLNYVSEYTIDNADTWEFKTFSFSGDIVSSTSVASSVSTEHTGVLQLLWVFAAGSTYNNANAGANTPSSILDKMATINQVNGLNSLGSICIYDVAVNAGTTWLSHSLPAIQEVSREIGPFIESSTDWEYAPSYSSGSTSGYSQAVAAHTSGTAGMTAYVPYKYRKIENTGAIVQVYVKASGGTAGNATWVNETGETNRATTATCQGSGGYTKSFVDGFTLSQTAATEIEGLVKFHYLANYYPLEF